MHELDVVQRNAGELLDQRSGVGASDLEVEPLDHLGCNAVIPLTQVVVDQETTTPKEHVVILAPPAENAFMDNLAVLVAVGHVLGLKDVELGEAIDRRIREQLEHVRPTVTALPQEGPVADIAGVLPGHAFVEPVGVFGQAPAGGEVTLGGLSEILRQHVCFPRLCASDRLAQPSKMMVLRPLGTTRSSR
ncbi:hypothetical protein FQZ97_984500 [compost metagenome]